jgi:hypothetical protein
MGTSGTGHDRCPSQVPEPIRRPGAISRWRHKNKKTSFWFQEAVKNFLARKAQTDSGRKKGRNPRTFATGAATFIWLRCSKQNRPVLSQLERPDVFDLDLNMSGRSLRFTDSSTARSPSNANGLKLVRQIGQSPGRLSRSTIRMKIAPGKRIGA